MISHLVMILLLSPLSALIHPLTLNDEMVRVRGRENSTPVLSHTWHSTQESPLGDAKNSSADTESPLNLFFEWEAKADGAVSRNDGTSCARLTGASLAFHQDHRGLDGRQADRCPASLRI